MKTVLLITNIPTPYRIPLFNVLDQQMKEKGWQLMVVFSGAGYKRRKFNIDLSQIRFRYTILKGGVFTPGKDSEKTYFFYKGLWGVLRTERPWRIIVSGFSPATFTVAFWHFLTRCPFLIWSGSIEAENRHNGILRRFSRRMLASWASACIAYGSQARKYLENLGVPSDKIRIGINTVDTGFFSEKTAALKALKGPNTTFTFTYIGYLVPRKNVKRVLDAVVHLHKRRSDFRLQIIGDGESKTELEKQCREEGLENIVHFYGYKQKEELPAYLSTTDVLLFQTDFDIWGLVLNEAMAAGVCCISTVKAGASHDLIREGENGLVTDFSDALQAAEKMNWAMEHPQEIQRMAAEASRFIRTEASLEKSAKGFIEAIEIS
ncbi:MAG: glycosyltransferase family 4 protein [Bacteroidia bacterium]|nr:glycosyltransferase family 4 protein [Bacteroidia bacterium]